MKPKKPKRKNLDPEDASFLTTVVILFFLIGLGIVFFSQTLAIRPYQISKNTMAPALIAGDRIFSNQLIYRFKNPKRGDLIALRYPSDPKAATIRRLVGLPGEKLEIKNGNLYINGYIVNTPEIPIGRLYQNRKDGFYGREGQIMEIPKDFYFVLADNSPSGSDSRDWGFIPRKDILGKIVCIWWPLHRVQKTFVLSRQKD